MLLYYRACFVCFIVSLANQSRLLTTTLHFYYLSLNVSYVFKCLKQVKSSPPSNNIPKTRLLKSRDYGSLIRGSNHWFRTNDSKRIRSFMNRKRPSVSESESLLLPWAVDIEAFSSWIQQSWTTFTRANNMSAIVPAARKATAAVSDVIIAILPSDFGV